MKQLSTSRTWRASAMACVLAFMLLVTPLFTACVNGPLGAPQREMTEGVVLPETTTHNCGANGATIKFSITTDAGYTLDVDDADMISIRANGSSTKAGTYVIDLNISYNTTGVERSGSVYISVEGHTRIKLMDIVQASGAMDDVVKWVDERLQKEYYWLDEYNQKLSLFDYSLAYDKYLSSTLMSLTTNMGDGGVYSDGSRYIYSYIIRESSNTGSSSQLRSSDSRSIDGFGIMLASTVWSYTSSTLAFAVDHIYPQSPASHCGMKRGDIITRINGSEIPRDYATYSSMWEIINNNSGSSLSLDGESYNPSTGKYEPFSYTLLANQYEENPVAYCGLVQFDQETQANVDPTHSKKIGHLVYLSFDNDFDDKLVGAIEQLAAEGITDLILDLRINGGGSVNSSIMLSSMILPESYIGKIYATLVRNPKNTVSAKTDECLIVKKGFGDNAVMDLPNLNLEKIWVITSSNTASASEMVIKGLEGLDVEVNIVGKTTEGKNCGMDVARRKFDSYTYTYAPITFINQNAKGDSDYADGITPQSNFMDYTALSTENETTVQRACRIFPMPEVEWDDFTHDFATYEAALQICGYSLLKNNGTLGLADMGFKAAGGAVTRAGGRTLSEVVADGKLRGKIYGATLTAEEREELQNVR